MSGLALAIGGMALAAGLDLAAGDPPNRYHPVAWMGSLVHVGETRLLKSPRLESDSPGWDWPAFLQGAALTLGGALLFSLPLWLFFHWLAPFSWPLALVLSAVGLKMPIAYRGLIRAARAVQGALAAGDLAEARRLVSWHLVSRDTSRLEEPLVAAATVESVAENLTDGLAAPLFYYLLGGLPAAWAYRYANTCDSMLGYHDPEHEYLGKFPARLDDVLNWLPARLTAFALVAGAWLAGEDAAGAWRTMWAQHGRTASPNAGWTMSAMAGALGVTLEKVGHYRLEGGKGALDACTIARSLRVARVTLALLLAGFSGAALAVYLVLR